jgi:hypothetical protein
LWQHGGSRIWPDLARITAMHQQTSAQPGEILAIRAVALRMAPMQARQMRLHHAPAADR